VDGDSVPMLYDAKLSQTMANELLKKGIYVIGFFFSVVPKDKNKSTVVCCTYKEHLDKAIAAFITVGKAKSYIIIFRLYNSHFRAGFLVFFNFLFCS
jgi:glycine C-acetyltransferase